MFREGEVIALLSKAGIQGGLTGLATGAYFGFATKVSRRGKTMNLPLYTSIVGALSSVASDVVHKVASKEIHISRKAEDQMATFLGVATSSIMYILALRMVEPRSASQMGYGVLATIGGGAEYGAAFLNNMLL